MDWFIANWLFVAELAATHLAISLLPIVLGSAVGVVLARIVPHRFAPATGGVLGSIYALPSLALFVVLPAIVGTDFLGPTNVVIALTLYVVAAMYFSARDAFQQVPHSTIVAATAMGMNTRQKFLHVDLPLAVPGLIAGVRAATASTLSIASIGAVVGVRNLGYLFIDGFQRKIVEEIVVGIATIAVIALFLDVALFMVGRLVAPWRTSQVNRA